MLTVTSPSLLYLTSVLYLPKCAVFTETWANTAHLCL